MCRGRNNPSRSPYSRHSSLPQPEIAYPLAPCNDTDASPGLWSQLVRRLVRDQACTQQQHSSYHRNSRKGHAIRRVTD